jgi:hypothetical protein
MQARQGTIDGGCFLSAGLTVSGWKMKGGGGSFSNRVIICAYYYVYVGGDISL